MDPEDYVPLAPKARQEGPPKRARYFETFLRGEKVCPSGPEVPTEIGNLFEVIEGLDRRIVELSQRLTPIRRSLSCAVNGDGSDGPRPPRAPLAEQLEGAALRIQSITNHLDSILAEIQV